MSKNDSCAGSAVLVNLEEDIDGDVGTIYGAEKKWWPNYNSRYYLLELPQVRQHKAHQMEAIFQMPYLQRQW